MLLNVGVTLRRDWRFLSAYAQLLVISLSNLKQIYSKIVEFSSSSWLVQRPADENVEKKIPLEESANNLFWQYRGKYISDMVTEVSNEQQSNDYQFGIRD